MPRLPRFYVYLLLCRDNGMIYTGYTANLCRRFKQHNADDNTGFTRGRRWHLLAVKRFLDRDTALLFERTVKKSRRYKTDWINSIGRLRTLRDRYGIQSNYLK